MKKLLIYLLLVTVFSLSSFGQTDFICYSGQGKVELATGETVSGKVNYCLSTPGRVDITPDGQSQDIKYKCDEVKGFTIEDKQYLSVKMKGGAVTIGSGESFGRLLTAPDSKIKIFVSETQPTVVVGGNFAVTVSYYASIPGDETAYALSDLKYTPFKKMTKYLEDCPSVVEKINNKEKDFSIPMLTTDEARLVVFTNVAREYQQCK